MHKKGDLIAILDRQTGRPIWCHKGLVGDDGLKNNVDQIPSVCNAIVSLPTKKGDVNSPAINAENYSWENISSIGRNEAVIFNIPNTDIEVCLERDSATGNLLEVYELHQDSELEAPIEKPLSRKPKAVTKTRKRKNDKHNMYIVVRWRPSHAESLKDEMLSSVINELEGRLTRSLRTSDVIERHASSQNMDYVFYIVAPNIEAEHKAAKVLEKIRLEMIRPVIYEKRDENNAMSVIEIPLEFSIAACASGLINKTLGDNVGVCPNQSICACGDNKPITVSGSSHDCYLALREKARRFSYIVFPRNIETDTEAHLLQAELYDTIRRGVSFQLHFQPQICVITGNVTGAEALLRWSREDGVPIPPQRILKAAQNAGFLNRLTDWIIETSFATSKHLANLGLEIPISINLCPNEVRGRDDLISFIEQHAQKLQINPALIEFELTETSALPLDESSDSIKRLIQLRDKGFSLAIDDFGAGYSSISYLKMLPASKLKIDRSLITGIDGNPINKGICKTLIDLARAFKMRIVAEGVENEQEMNAVSKLGCNYIQGYFTGRPAPLDALISLARSTGQLDPEKPSLTGADPKSKSAIKSSD